MGNERQNKKKTYGKIKKKLTAKEKRPTAKRKNLTAKRKRLTAKEKKPHGQKNNLRSKVKDSL